MIFQGSGCKKFKNLNIELKKTPFVDIFHYDSDKSYSGREFALQLVNKHMSSESITIMDDIQDNSFFYDLVNQDSSINWRIFYFEGKYVGLIGKL